jgi:hypothetical protein
LDEEIRKSLVANVPGAAFNEKNQLVKNTDGFLSVNFCFLDHVITPKEDGIVESMTLSVSKTVNRRPQSFHTKQIIFDYERFRYLCSVPDDRASRNQKLLNVAAEMLKGL